MGFDLHKTLIRAGFYARYRKSYLWGPLKELEESQWLSPEEVRELQWRKLMALLKHAYHNVPYYQRVMDELGILPEDVKSPADFARLPILTKQMVRDNLDDLITRGLAKEDLIKMASGGSTGLPVTLYHDSRMITYRKAAKIRNFGWAGWQVGDTWARLWGSAFDIAPHFQLSHMLFDKLTRVLILPAFDMTEDTMLRYATQLARFRPTVLEAYTTPLYTFAQFLEAERITNVRPGAIIASAEMLHNHKRSLIESVLGCQVFNRYGGREMSDVSQECSEETMHINAENVYVEFVRNGRPANVGESGEIILTALNNYAMPLLRYRIEDIGSPSDKVCSCGRGLPAMTMIEGRVQDMIVLKGNRYLPGEFFPHLFKDFDIGKFQVVQESLDKLVIKMMQGSRLRTHELAYLLDKIEEYTRGNIEIEFQLVDDIPLTKSGKFRYTISKVPVNFVAEE